MIRFLLGFASLHFLVAGWIILDIVSGRRVDDAGATLLSVTVVPLLLAWVAIETATAFRARRLFDPRHPRPWRAMLLGVMTAGISLVVTTLLIAFLDSYVATALLAAAAAFVVTSACAWCLPVVRWGCCASCRYDMRGVLSDRCPECGAGQVAVQGWAPRRGRLEA